MQLTEPLILPPDVRLVPVGELPAALTHRLAPKPGDFAVFRPRSRARLKLLNRASADLLSGFRQPRSIVDAVADFCHDHRLDPRQAIESAYPLLRELLTERLLAPADSVEAGPILPTFQPEQRVGEWIVISCVNLKIDTEVYQVRTESGRVAALKVARSDDPRLQRVLLHEMEILERLDGVVSPGLVGTGSYADRTFVVVDWRFGTFPDVLAREDREDLTGAKTDMLRNLCCHILDAYAHLHAQDVIHGDVHPRNILVDSEGSITLLDYGLARVGQSHASGAPPRGGIEHLFEPEYARAVLAGGSVPPTTRAGEQYALGALLYSLFTGQQYFEPSADRLRLFQQITETPPLPFARVGVRAWPEVEATLRRALNKAPNARFRSVSQFADRLRCAAPAPPRPPRPGVGDRGLKAVLDRLGLDGPLIDRGLDRAPTASLNYGAAGIAYGMYRIACALDDPTVLAAAEAWLHRALAESRHERGFRRDEGDRSRAVLGQVSPYHSECGVHVVRATLARAVGDGECLGAASRDFANASRAECANADLTLGRAGTLLGCVMLRELAINEPSPDTLALGTDTFDRLLARPDHPLTGAAGRPNLGVAHGWAGIAYVMLRWCALEAIDPPEAVIMRLNELAERAEPWGRGLRWRWITGGAAPRAEALYMPGWCNGSAGFVHLWTLCHRVLGEDRFLGMAYGAAWSTWESSAAADSIDLCCGLAGRAYALLNLHRHVGERAWLERAHVLAARAVKRAGNGTVPEYRDSLYRGHLGLAVLLADLDRVDDAAMPFFESERWPRPAAQRR